VQEI
jgi:hypothetical protein